MRTIIAQGPPGRGSTSYQVHDSSTREAAVRSEEALPGEVTGEQVVHPTACIGYELPPTTDYRILCGEDILIERHSVIRGYIKLQSGDGLLQLQSGLPLELQPGTKV